MASSKISLISFPLNLDSFSKEYVETLKGSKKALYTAVRSCTPNDIQDSTKKDVPRTPKGLPLSLVGLWKSERFCANPENLW